MADADASSGSPSSMLYERRIMPERAGHRYRSGKLRVVHSLLPFVELSIFFMEGGVMVRITGEQLHKAGGLVRSEARKAPVEVTYHGRPELVVLSVEDYALLRQNRKVALASVEMSAEKLRRIANNRMDPEQAELDSLMDD
jgi:prevent-host-death family protein